MKRVQVIDNCDPEKAGRVLTEDGWLSPLVTSENCLFDIPSIDSFVYTFDGIYIIEGYSWRAKD